MPPRWVILAVVAVAGIAAGVVVAVPALREAVLAAVGALFGAGVYARSRANGQRRQEVEAARRTVEVRTVERNERIAEREAADAARVESAPTETAMPEGLTDEQRAEAERLLELWK